MKNIKVRAEVSGKVATIRTEGLTKYARILIEIPTIRFASAHDRRDLNIDVLSASYAHMKASVTFVDVRAIPLGIIKDGGIGSLFEWSGGKYTVSFAGDLILSQTN